MKPKIVRTIADLRRVTKSWRITNHDYAVVPTMGALHDGHLALVRAAKALADRVIVTIFVNPRQFSANEDLSRYPRDEDGDVAKLEKAGANLIFAPAPDEIYPAHHQRYARLDLRCNGIGHAVQVKAALAQRLAMV